MDKRPSARKRGYDAAWERTRAAFVSAHPICSVPGCGRPTTDVDHIELVRNRLDLRLSWSNLRAFCHAHHSAKTAAEDGGFGNPSGGPRPVKGVGQDGRPLDPDHPWHRGGGL